LEDIYLPLLAALVPEAVVALLLCGHIVVEVFPFQAQGWSSLSLTRRTAGFLHYNPISGGSVTSDYKLCNSDCLIFRLIASRAG